MTIQMMHQMPGRVRAVWTLQEEGHHIVKIGESTLGHVVMVPDGSFIAFDGKSTLLGRHQTLRAAQLSILRAADGSDASRFDRWGPVLAIVVGAVAAGLLTMGVVVLSVMP